MADNVQVQKTAKYADALFSVQCCLGDKFYEVYESESLGNECNERIQRQINIAIAMLKTLRRQKLDFEDCEVSCLTFAEIKTIMRKLKKICHDCCMDLSFLDECVEQEQE